MLPLTVVIAYFLNIFKVTLKLFIKLIGWDLRLKSFENKREFCVVVLNSTSTQYSIISNFSQFPKAMLHYFCTSRLYSVQVQTSISKEIIQEIIDVFSVLLRNTVKRFTLFFLFCNNVTLLVSDKYKRGSKSFPLYDGNWSKSKEINTWFRRCVPFILD